MHGPFLEVFNHIIAGHHRIECRYQFHEHDDVHGHVHPLAHRHYDPHHYPHSYD